MAGKKKPSRPIARRGVDVLSGELFAAAGDAAPPAPPPVGARGGGRGRGRIVAAGAVRRAQLSRVRDERGHGPRAARCRRRPETGAAANPLRDARIGPLRARAARQVGARGRRRAGQVPPARRHGRLRCAGAPGAGFQLALPADRWAGQFRFARRRQRRGDALHRVSPDPDRRVAAGGNRPGHGRLRAELRRRVQGAEAPAGAPAHAAAQRHLGHRRRHGD